MRKAVFCMHTGVGQEAALLSAFRTSLNEEWCLIDDDLESMHGTQDNYALIDAGVEKRFQRFSNSAKGIIEVNDAFIKNFNQQATVKFRKNLQLIHLVQDPMTAASTLTALGTCPDRTNTKHLRNGRHIEFKEEWSPFQRNLWEWVDCNIVAVFLSQEIGRANVFVLPDHSMWHGKIDECLKWVQDDLVFGLDRAQFQTTLAYTDQEGIESFTWYNSLKPSEQRMTNMLFKELMAINALESPPDFVKNRI